MHDIGMQLINHGTQPIHEGPDVHPSNGGIQLLFKKFLCAY